MTDTQVNKLLVQLALMNLSLAIMVSNQIEDDDDRTLFQETHAALGHDLNKAMGLT